VHFLRVVEIRTAPDLRQFDLRKQFVRQNVAGRVGRKFLDDAKPKTRLEIVQQRRAQQLVRTAAHQHHLGDPPVSPCLAVVGLAVGKPLRGLGKAWPILLRLQRAQQAISRRCVHS
jgi:hypothetical protein